MINLGPYSGKDCPNVRYQPRVIDRILDGVALFLLLAICGAICWLYIHVAAPLSKNVWVLGGMAVLISAIMYFCSYAPVRLVNFPVRVHKLNIAVQYLLAIRFVKVLSVILNLSFLFGVFMDYYKWASILFGSSFVLLILAFIGYYIVAFSYR